jgi:hypothetical protein
MELCGWVGGGEGRWTALEREGDAFRYTWRRDGERLAR